MSDVDMDDVELDVDESQYMYLTFDVAGEVYAVNIQAVTTIVGAQRISEIPGLPQYIKGAINLRGKVIPLMDLRLRFGLPWKEYDDRSTTIVLDIQDTSMGLVVDKVNDVLTIPPDKVSPSPRRQGSADSGVILGIGKLDQQVCVILDAVRLIANQDLDMDMSLDHGLIESMKA